MSSTFKSLRSDLQLVQSIQRTVYKLLDKTEYLEERLQHQLEELKEQSSSSRRRKRQRQGGNHSRHELIRPSRWQMHDAKFEGHYGLGNTHDRHSHQSDYAIHDLDEEREDVGYNEDENSNAEQHIRCDTHMNPPDQPFPGSRAAEDAHESSIKRLEELERLHRLKADELERQRRALTHTYADGDEDDDDYIYDDDEYYENDDYYDEYDDMEMHDDEDEDEDEYDYGEQELVDAAGGELHDEEAGVSDTERFKGIYSNAQERIAKSINDTLRRTAEDASEDEENKLATATSAAAASSEQPSSSVAANAKRQLMSRGRGRRGRGGGRTGKTTRRTIKNVEKATALNGGVASSSTSSTRTRQTPKLANKRKTPTTASTSTRQSKRTSRRTSA